MVTNQSSLLDPWTYEDPIRFEPFWFEEKFNLHETRLWAKERHGLVTAICAAYITFAWAGPVWMNKRPAFNLQKPLVAWNLCFALFSIVCCIRVLPEFMYILSLPDGFYRAACVKEGLNPPAAFWGWMFTVSKVFELGDTVFIILRKKKLQLLHWFHHCTVLYFCFVLFIEAEPMSRWAVMNVIVHSFMYTYFALAAMNVRIPRKISMVITSMQILQFVIALFVNFYTMAVIAKGTPCVRSPTSIRLQLFIIASYLMLFLHFFYKAYMSKSKKA